MTSGPLADVHANGTIKARALSMDISGKITAKTQYNNTGIMPKRSFDYKSLKSSASHVNFRALKVDEFLNSTIMGEHYVLTSTGEAVVRANGLADQPAEIPNIDFSFNGINKQWTITTTVGQLNLPLVAETNLNIDAQVLSVYGTLMVQGALHALGELNINTGTPFNQALVVDRDITLDKLITIGRIHGSGTFTSHGEVHIFGNAEIDGDVTLFGDARINFLDHVYKAAIAEAQQEPMLADPYASADAYSDPQLMLAHSQLFSDAAGNNSVVLFTFVEGGYLLNENVIFELIANHQKQDFKFRSYLYGASLDNPAQLQKADGLSPYYANKLALINKLKADSGGQIRMTESLDMAPSNFYHTFEDSQGMNLGTYQVYAMSAQFDINNVPMLTQKERDAAIYNLEHKAEIEAQREAEARQSLIDQKAALYLDTAIDPYSQQAMIAEIEAAQAEMDAINPLAAKTEAEQARLDEWVSYKDMPTTTVDIIAEQVVVPNEVNSTRSLNKRGWIKRIAKRVTRVVVRPVCSILSSPFKTIDGVSGSPNLGIWSYYYDWWSQTIALNNNGNFCAPISAAMILNYHHWRKFHVGAYSRNRNHYSRTHAASANANPVCRSYAHRSSKWDYCNHNNR